MKFLFVHQNFPAQFIHLAPALARQGHEVVALHIHAASNIPGVRTYQYAARATEKTSGGVHPWLEDLNTKVIRAEAAWQAARQISADGFKPDAIIAHPGWGESLFLKEVWPSARLGLYCEYFYRPRGGDVGFDPEFAATDAAVNCRLQLKNANFELQFLQAEAGLAPTHWQASTFPSNFRERISVIHDGIDTDRLQPNSNARLRLKTRMGQDLTISGDDELITFVNRNLEPYRGYHVFMRALPHILKQRPRARVLIVGGSGVSYGSAPPRRAAAQGQTDGAVDSWKEIFLREVAAELDMSRVHFLGRVPYKNYVSLMQLSKAHVYLTYPFVLSWSLLEAMSMGCAVVASDTAPVREVVSHEETGLLVDFFDREGLVDAVVSLLDDPERRVQLGQTARAYVRSNYDLHRISLPKQIEWAQHLL